jgi:beta-glucosidase
VRTDGAVDVTVDVTNTGARAGEEVVQLYVGFEGSKVERPVKLLRGFAKVALEPGRTRTVPLRVAARDLAWYDAGGKAWRVEPMAYTVLVGPSSRGSDLLKGVFRVAE